MQIILVQTEVEQAIKDYISHRLTVSEGTDIQIDLTATRGAEGVKAIIDLIPNTPKVSGAKRPYTPRATAAVSAIDEAKTTGPTSERAPEPVVETQAAPDSVENEAIIGDAVEEAVEETSAVAEVPATPPVKSLFSNLRKPVNT